MPKRKKDTKNKTPNIGENLIFGIVDFEIGKIVAVAMTEEEIWYEYDTQMMDHDRFQVAKFTVQLPM